MNVATTTVENLLRVARSEAAASTAFVALLGDAYPPQIVAVPPPGTSEELSSDELATLVRQAAADPEFLHARVFVRGVHMGGPKTLAVAPLRDGVGYSMIGIVTEPDRQFQPAQLEVLERLAQRLLRHFQVVQQMNGGGTSDEEPTAPPAAREADPSDEPRPADPLNGVSVPPGGWSAPTRVAGEMPEVLRPPWSVPSPEPASAASPPEPFVAPTEPSPAQWWSDPDPVTGLLSLGRFFSRAGKMLASDDRTTGSLAIVVVRVPDADSMPEAARVLRMQLRYSDPVARVDSDLLAVAVLLVPAGTGPVVEQRLGSAVRSVLERGELVRTTHVVAEPGGRRDVDELLREAISRLPVR